MMLLCLEHYRLSKMAGLMEGAGLQVVESAVYWADGAVHCGKCKDLKLMVVIDDFREVVSFGQNGVGSFCLVAHLGDG